MTTAWSLYAADEPQFQGNTGYKDDPELFYSFDSTVPNCERVGAGDLGVVRDGEWVRSIVWIERIDETSGRKVRRRCPRCTLTGFKARSTMEPRFRCGDCGALFDHPAIEEIAVTFYRAWFADGWVLDPPLGASELSTLMNDRASQHAIREISIEGLRDLLTSRYRPRPNWWWIDPA